MKILGWGLLVVWFVGCVLAITYGLAELGNPTALWFWELFGVVP